MLSRFQFIALLTLCSCGVFAEEAPKLDAAKYPQDTPEHALESVVKALEAEDFGYWLSYIVTPDSRLFRQLGLYEAPVIDTSCAALLQLAHRVHACGQKVVLTGEGADEWLVGYPWYKAAKLLGFLDIVPGLPLSDQVRRAYLRR